MSLGDERGGPLYAIVGEYLDVLDAIAEAGGEITEEVEERLALAGADIEAKVERCALAIADRSAQADAVRLLAAHYTERARSWERAVERLREYVLQQMERAGVQKVKRPLATVSVLQSHRVVLSVEPEGLPERFRRVRVEAMKAELAAALKRGEVVEGARLEATSHLSIR
jgi:hypothetical protein